MMSNTNSELQAYLEQSLPELMAELSLYDDTTRSPADTWAKIAGLVRRRVCDEWGWCEVRQDARFENDYDLGVAVLAILSTGPLNLSISVDFVLISAILVKRGLDVFCGCL